MISLDAERVEFNSKVQNLPVYLIGETVLNKETNMINFCVNLKMWQHRPGD